MLIHVSKKNKLYNAFSDQFEFQLYQAFKPLKSLGCDYFYFLASDAENSYRFCSHDYWLDHYYDEQFVLNDPLKRIIEHSNFIILPWEQISHINRDEQKTMLGRISFGIFNGLTIAQTYKKRKYVFALATESKEHDLGRYFLLEKVNQLEQVICECIKLVDQYLLLMLNPVTQFM